MFEDICEGVLSEFTAYRSKLNFDIGKGFGFVGMRDKERSLGADWLWKTFRDGSGYDRGDDLRRANLEFQEVKRVRDNNWWKRTEHGREMAREKSRRYRARKKAQNVT